MQVRLILNFPDLGSRIREAREANNLSQKQLGNIIGVTPARISEYECQTEGKSTITIETLTVLEKNLNKTLVSSTELMTQLISSYENAKNLQNEL